MGVRQYFLVIPAVVVIAFITGGSLVFAVTRLKTPSMAPPYVHPNAGKSPGEIMAETKKKLDAAIKKRQKRGLPVDPDNARLVDPLYALEYKPARDYSKQPCYHITGSTDPDEFVFCDAEKCVFPDIASGYPDGGYCKHKTRDCYDRDGKLILDGQGKSVTDSQHALSVRWDMCLEKDGSPVTPKGEKSFDEKIKAGCGYRVGKKIHPYLVGYIGYMMACDAQRCIFHPSGMVYNRETKLFRTSDYETKTPPNEYYPYLDWKCLDGKQANRVARKYRCSIVSEDKENWGCEVCFENGKNVYRNCKYKYNEKSEIVGTRVPMSAALEEQFEELEEASDEFEQNPKTHYIVEAMYTIMMTLRRTPTSDAVQGKVVALFESFFDRRDDETWSVAKLGQELATLRIKIRGAMKN